MTESAFCLFFPVILEKISFMNTGHFFFFHVRDLDLILKLENALTVKVL